MRHPRNCKYWKGATEGDECSYLHDNGKNVKVNDVRETIKERYAENKTNENKETSADLKIVELDKLSSKKMKSSMILK